MNSMNLLILSGIKKVFLFAYVLPILKGQITVDLDENYFIDIRLTKCDREHKRSTNNT